MSLLRRLFRSSPAPAPAAPGDAPAPRYGIIDTARALSFAEMEADVQGETRAGREAGVADEDRAVLLLAEVHDGAVEIGVRPEAAAALATYLNHLASGERLSKLEHGVATYRFLQQSDKPDALALYAADLNAGYDATVQALGLPPGRAAAAGVDGRVLAVSNPAMVADYNLIPTQEEWVARIAGETRDLLSAGRPMADVRAEYVDEVMDTWTTYGVQAAIVQGVGETLRAESLDTVISYFACYRFCETIGREYMWRVCAAINERYRPHLAARDAAAAHAALEPQSRAENAPTDESWAAASWAEPWVPLPPAIAARLAPPPIPDPDV